MNYYLYPLVKCFLAIFLVPTVLVMVEMEKHSV